MHMHQPLVLLPGTEVLNPSRRRAREEVEDPATYGSSSFGEHRNKRVMSGMVASTKRWSGPPAFSLTSAPDNEHSAHTPSGFVPPSNLPSDITVDHYANEDTSMDMDMEQPPSGGLDPGPFHSEPIVSTVASRAPTPIQPGFRQGLWEHGPPPEPSCGINHPEHNQGAELEPWLAGDQAIPRTVTSDLEWAGVRNRRLPSPISEGEATPSILHRNSGASTPLLVVDGGFTAHLADRLASQVSISTPEERTDDPMADPGIAGDDVSSYVDVSDLPTTPPSARKGHMRSRHTIDSWTWQPGMKKTFSMGYRTDCEKCRMKVPGHFNHIIIS